MSFSDRWLSMITTLVVQTFPHKRNISRTSALLRSVLLIIHLAIWFGQSRTTDTHRLCRVRRTTLGEEGGSLLLPGRDPWVTTT